MIDKKYQWICLLGTSILFYSWFGSGNLLLILITGTTTWIGAVWMSGLSKNFAKYKKDKNLDSDAKKCLKESLKKKRKRIMLGVLFLNFGILIYIKSIIL